MSEKTPHEIRDHAELGGSKAERWVNCYGSVSLARKLPELPETEAAKEGTAAHEEAEKLLTDFLNWKVTGENPVKIPQDDSIGGYVTAIWEMGLDRSITQKIWGVETNFVLDEQLQMYGILDFYTFYRDDSAKRAGYIADYKNGYRYIPESKNAQLAFYSVALRQYARDNGKDLDYVRAAIFQPNCPGYKPYRETKFSTAQLDMWEKKFKKAAHAIYVEKSTKLKMGRWCKYCPAQGVCPKYSKELENNTALAMVNTSGKLPDVKTIDDKKILEILKLAPRLEDFIKSIKEFAISRYMDGKPVPGTKMVQGKARRKWIDDEEKIGKALEAAGVNPWNKKLKGITEMERIFEPASLAKFITMTDPKPTLVLEDDERPAIQNNLELLEENKNG